MPPTVAPTGSTHSRVTDEQHPAPAGPTGRAHGRCLCALPGDRYSQTNRGRVRDCVGEDASSVRSTASLRAAAFRKSWGRSRSPSASRPTVPCSSSAGRRAAGPTWSHIDGAGVFPGAPEGQAALDWMLSIYGPEGEPAETWWKNVRRPRSFSSSFCSAGSCAACWPG